MRVFITGATGYIGFNVALAFRRAGHEVWGLVRSSEKAGALAENEIRPVLGDMERPQTYSSIAEQCSIFVHTAVDRQAREELDKKTVETLLKVSKKADTPKTLIYTSGVWLYGNTGDRLVDETEPLNPIKYSAYRVAHEKMVLNTSGVKGVVIHPGVVYGRQGGLTGNWFMGAAQDKTIEVVGDGSNRMALVHVVDLAEGYLRVAESGVGGEIFNMVDRSRATVREMVQAAARAAAYTGQIHHIPLDEASNIIGGLAEGLALDQNIDSRKAARLLGWQPKHLGFVDEVDAYYAAWNAFHRRSSST